MGVVTDGDTQYIYIDTPGFHRPKTKLGEKMVKTVRESAADIDCVLFMVTPKSEFDDLDRELLGELSGYGVPVVLVINKCDTLRDKSAGPRYADQLSKRHEFSACVLISARDGDGVDLLVREIDKYSVPGPHPFPEDTLTDVPEKVIVAELIREKLLMHLSDELPHGCAVTVESFKERENSDIIDIEAEIVCEKKSHKGMIIGKNGGMLKKIGSAARAETERFLDCRVNLQLWVKVREKWREKSSFVETIVPN